MRKDIVQYTKLKEKTERPVFSYVVLIADEHGVLEDYYLFKLDEFEEAYSILRTEATKDEYSSSTICEIGFHNADRTYYLQPIFGVYYGKVVYDKYMDPLLHVVWHMKAGEWLNPREDI